MSTWRSLVDILSLLPITRRIVCWLSQAILNGASRTSYISLKRRFRAIVSFAVSLRASSSASVVEVVTVACRLAFQMTGPPNSWMRYPWDDFLVSGSSAKDASVDIAIA